MNEIIDSFDYTEHFNNSKIRGNLLQLLKEKTGKRIDEGVMIYHLLFFDPYHEINPF